MASATSNFATAVIDALGDFDERGPRNSDRIGSLGIGSQEFADIGRILIGILANTHGLDLARLSEDKRRKLTFIFADAFMLGMLVGLRLRKLRVKHS